MKVIYVVGKYTDKLRIEKKRNIEKAVLEGVKLATEGWCVIVPHLNFKWHEEAMDYEFVMKECFELIKRSDALYVCNNYKKSKGSLREIEYAKSIKKKIIYDEAK